MVLVNLLVYGGRDILMLVRPDVLVDDGRADIFVNNGLMLAAVGNERVHGLLCFVHIESWMANSLPSAINCKMNGMNVY